jgi:murein DD-endopeptidase MepM/ murein hydrolase activator NlpD
LNDNNLNLRLLVLLFLFISLGLSAQQNPAKKKGDFTEIKVPGRLSVSDSLSKKGKKINSSTQESDEYEELLDSEGEQEEEFELDKELSIVSEDTLNPRLGEGGIVEVSEEILVDSNWIEVASYYSIWDSRKVNPYKIDPTKRKDTLSIKLFQPNVKYMGWTMPGESLFPTSRFGPRRGRYHYGIDLRVRVGDTIRAAFAGIVRMVQVDRRGYGKYVLVRHFNGLETLYGHLSRQLVAVGQYIDAGHPLGLGGSTGRSTGPHLHFEVRYEGNPIDPELMYDFSQQSIVTDEFELLPEHYEYIREMRRAIYHRVRSGETLGHIARRYGVRISTITRLNRISTRKPLRVGRKLRIR